MVPAIAACWDGGISPLRCPPPPCPHPACPLNHMHDLADCPFASLVSPCAFPQMKEGETFESDTDTEVRWVSLLASLHAASAVLRAYL